MRHLVEISVAVHNKWNVTEAFLNNLFSSIKSYGHVAVNIIDNASTDRTVVELDKFDKKASIFYNMLNIGYASAHNSIIRKSFANFSCIIHNDVVFKDNWLDKMVDRMQDDVRLGVLGVVNNVSGVLNIGGVLEDNGMHIQKSLNDRIEDYDLDFVSSGCLLIRHGVFSKVGAFDEKYIFGFNSDVDFCVLAKDNGFLLGVCKDVQIVHNLGMTASDVGVEKYSEENRIYFVKKNRNWLEKNKGRAVLRRARRM